MRHFLALSARIGLILTYIQVFVWSIQYNIVPLLELYGGWAWLGTNLFLAIAGFFCGFFFIFTFGYEKKDTPRNPMATYKETS